MPRSLIGTRIRERRRARKISQSGLAKEVGISASYLNLIEHNRRGIAGKTLLSLAKVLETSPGYLTEGADQGLIDRIQKAAASHKLVESEVERIEEFIGRFPGFAKLIERLHDQLEIQDQNLQALSDKMSNDPAFAEAMHLMLSSITIIRSTADILMTSDDISEERRSKFLSNLLAESQRLSVTAGEVLQHFEPADKDIGYERDHLKIETFMEANGFYVDELEGEANGVDPEAAAAKLVAALKIPQADRQRSVSVLASYRSMAARLPGERFLREAKRLRYDPLALGQAFGEPLPSVFWRLAHLPDGEGQPAFGMLECDGSGSVLYRKQLPSFSLPRYSGACPLWPIYRCLGQPMQPVSAVMTMPNGERFICYAIAMYRSQGDLGVPGQLKTTMIFTKDHEHLISKAGLAALPHLAVGFQCSVCPRDGCSSRRNGYLLN